MWRKLYGTPDGQSGLFFTLFGAALLVGSLRYALGTASQMGPGFFPLCLSILLIAIGLVIGAKAVFADGAPPMPKLEMRPLVAITAAIVLAGALLPTAGLAVSIPVMVLVSVLAAPRPRWIEALITAVALLAGAYLIFVVGLGLPIPLLRS